MTDELDELDELDKMWAALAEHEPAPEYAKAWQRMLKDRTPQSAWASWAAAREASAWAAAEAAAEAAGAENAAQRAIDAIRRVQP